MAKTYVNMDAAYLAKSAEELKAMPEGFNLLPARMVEIADRLESLDEKLRNLQSAPQEDRPTNSLEAKVLYDLVLKLESGPHHFKPGSIESVQLRHAVAQLDRTMPTKTYEDGRRDERIAMLGRSNLPPQSVELSPDLAKAIALAPVTKIAPKVKAKKERPEEFKELDSLLLDIDLDDFDI